MGTQEKQWARDYNRALFLLEGLPEDYIKKAIIALQKQIRKPPREETVNLGK